MEQDTSPRERVINFDGLWSTLARVYSVGDVSLGRRGVPQMVLVYGLAGVFAAVVILFVPLLGAVIAAVLPGLAWVGGVGMLFGAAGAWRPDGVPMHVLGPVIARHPFRARVLLGWLALSDATHAWRPDDLVLEDDGSRAVFAPMEFVGPGRIVRARPAIRGRCRSNVIDRMLGRPASEWMCERPGPALSTPRVIDVPVGRRVRIQAHEKA